MPKAFLFIFLFLLCQNSFSQDYILIKDKNNFSAEEIASVQSNFIEAHKTIEKAKLYLGRIIEKDENKWIDIWNSDESITVWLGKASSQKHIKKAYSRIEKMFNKSSGKVRIVFNRERRNGLCHGSRHAWTIPFGLVKIHLCPQFMFKSDQFQSKIMVHELAHESGILFHKKVYWRSTALRVAQNSPELALKNPENYAFFIMSFYSKNRD